MNPQEKLCEPSIFSPAGVVDYTPILSSGIPLLQPLNGTPTLVPSSEVEPRTGGFPACGCTKETFVCLTHPNTRDGWIASMRASLARILALPAEARESTANAPDFTGRCSESPVLYDRATSSWKTPQQSFLEDSEPSLGTWPSSGMMRDGLSWPLPRLAPRTSGIDGGALLGVPTPTASMVTMADMVQAKYAGNGGNRPTYQQAKSWPTPQAHDQTKGNPARVGRFGTKHGGRNLNDEAGGSLNPMWVAWLMGWPLEATKLNVLETAKFLSARRRPGKSSVEKLKGEPCEPPNLEKGSK